MVSKKNHYLHEVFGDKVNGGICYGIALALFIMSAGLCYASKGDIFCQYSISSGSELSSADSLSSTDSLPSIDRTLSLVCEVRDHLTHDAVKVRKASLLRACDSVMIDTVKMAYYKTNYYSSSFISINVKQPGEYLVCMEADSFHTAFMPLEIKKMYKREKSRTLPPLYMRRMTKGRNDMELDEVVVKATKLKFYMDGDTLVYDADAFSLSEGSMIDMLIKKLPGVTLESGGVIKVNGRKVDALLLNGKDFFDNNRELLLENMPAYMVNKIQSYERVPERLKGTPLAENARKELVMNVKLKRDYSAGWLYNADIGGGRSFYDTYNDSGSDADGDSGRHAYKFSDRLFAMRFSDVSSLVCYANANNVNDETTPGQRGEWSPLAQTNGVTTSCMAGANYTTEKPDVYRYNMSVDGTYKADDEANNVNAATFLDGGNTYSRSFYAKKSYECNVTTNHSLMLQHTDNWRDVAKYIYINVNPYFSYRHWNNRSSSGSVTLSDDVSSSLGKAWIDSIKAVGGSELLKKYAINRNLSQSRGTGHSASEQVNANASFCPAHNDYLLFAIGINQSWSDDTNDAFEHYRLDYPSSETLPNDFRNKYAPQVSRASSICSDQKMDVHLDDKNINIVYLKNTASHSHSYSNSPIYLLHKLEEWAMDAKGDCSKMLGMLPSEEEMLKTIDKDNSSRSKTVVNSLSPQLGYRYSKSTDDVYVSFDAGVSLPIEHERLQYVRGTQIDTLARRTTLMANPSVNVYYSNFKKGLSLSFDYSMTHTAPSMVNMLSMRDDSDPLNVMLGNADLRSTVTHTFSASYADRYGKASVNAYANVGVADNAIASGFVYDKSTGVRTIKPQNVDGNWTLSSGIALSAPLLADYKMSLSHDLSYQRVHSVDITGTDDMQAQRSVVMTDNLTESLSLSWQPADIFECGADGKLDYQHSASKRADFSGINAFTYQYGLRAQVDLPWSVRLSTDVTMYSRRGYSEDAMNTDELVWNARVEKKVPGANLTIIFDGFDLLGNLSSVQRYINAQGRTETFYNVMPSYGLLHVLWRPGSKKKAKQAH